MRKLRAEPGAFLTATDLRGVTPAAAGRALSRLAQEGLLQRVRKGLYYVPRETLIGKSRPSEPAVTQKVIARKGRPTGVTAANLLGMSTQVAARPEFALYTSAPPQGTGAARLHLRPRIRVQELPTKDAALLEFVRDRGCYGELDAQETCARARAILLEEGTAKPAARTARLRCLRDAALVEPPRVRAILGALMQSADLPESLWKPLRESLNAFSRFDFGLFRALPNAREWQAK
jgi:uncharacterized protein DUF6088